MAHKTLFDHINHITASQTKDYWNTLSTKDISSWSNYMIHRFLSMKMDWCEIVNDIQQYNLEPKVLYQLYIDILPKGKQWLKYIKKQGKSIYPNWAIELIAKYYEVGLTEAEDYIKLFYATKDGKAELKEIVEMYGIDPKLVKKLKL